MPQARIYQPAKTAMQSGKAKCQQWRLEFHVPLKIRTSRSNTLSQLELSFDSLEEAMAYAQRMGITVEVTPPNVRKIHRRAYSDNFKNGRVEG